MEKNNGLIYILTNPSYKEYIKIGYTTNLDERIRSLSDKTAVPYSFHAYAIWNVPDKIMKLYSKPDDFIHKKIDIIDPNLRCIEINENGKKKIREFYVMTPERAFEILNILTEDYWDESKPILCDLTETEIDDLDSADEDKILSSLNHNRHHFKEIDYYSSLTGKKYKSITKSNGTLGVLDIETGVEVPDRANPSKRQILKQALLDLNGEVLHNDTLYQLQHKLEKIVLNKKED